MTRFTSKPILSSVLVCLIALLCLHSVQPFKSRPKEEYYAQLETLCYPQDLYHRVYQPYQKSKGTFYWLDLFMNKLENYSNIVFKYGSRFLYKNMSSKSYYEPYSNDQAIEFYQNTFDLSNYVIAVNNQKTFLHNPDSKTFLTLFDGCYLEKNSGFNKLYRTVEKLSPLKSKLFVDKSQEDHTATLFKVLYQVGRGLLYLLQNEHHSIDIVPENVGYRKINDFVIFKLMNPLGIRSQCDPNNFAKYMSKEFLQLYKTIENDDTPEGLKFIQDKLNVCGNIILKEFLLLFEGISKAYPVNKFMFSWNACFDIEAKNTFCPQKLKDLLARKPEQTDTLIKVLNGKHYTYLNPDELMLQVLELVGGYLESGFDLQEVRENHQSSLLRLEM